MKISSHFTQEKNTAITCHYLLLYQWDYIFKGESKQSEEEEEDAKKKKNRAKQLVTKILCLQHTSFQINKHGFTFFYNQNSTAYEQQAAAKHEKEEDQANLNSFLSKSKKDRLKSYKEKCRLIRVLDSSNQDLLTVGNR